MTTMGQRRAIIIFPAIAVAFSVSCASAGSAPVGPQPAAGAQPAATSTVSKASAGAARTPATGVALDTLSRIPIRREQPAGYARSKFRHWVDADGDSCNTREEALIEESSSPAQVDMFGCKVLAGDWYSTYDKVTVTDPSGLDVDHVVALKEAWDSGAGKWSAARREAFANDLSDPRALVAVTASSNRSKGDKDPPQWMPRNTAMHCTYLSDWVAVKSRWSLSMDESEYRFIEKRLKGACSGTTIAPWGSPAPSPAAPSPGSTATTVPTQGSTPSSGAQTTIAPATTAPAKGGTLPTIKPGAFCSPQGAQGTYSGTAYVCSTTKTDGTPYSDGRARWRRV
jgi:hypothetical protein